MSIKSNPLYQHAANAIKAGNGRWDELPSWRYQLEGTKIKNQKAFVIIQARFRDLQSFILFLKALTP
jgi:hypothetical protein